MFLAAPPPQACMLKNLSFSVSENELGHVFCLRNANNFHFQVEKRKYTQANMPSRMWLSSVPGSKGTPRATYKEANPCSVWVPNLGKENKVVVNDVGNILARPSFKLIMIREAIMCPPMALPPFLPFPFLSVKDMNLVPMLRAKTERREEFNQYAINQGPRNQFHTKCLLPEFFPMATTNSAKRTLRQKCCDKTRETLQSRHHTEQFFLHGSGDSCHMAIHVHAALNYPFFGLCRVSAGPGSWGPVALPSSPWRECFFDDSINAQKFTKLCEKNARSSQEM